MNKQTRRKLMPEFKAKVALEALKEHSTLSEIAKILKSVLGYFPLEIGICRQYVGYI